MAFRRCTLALASAFLSAQGLRKHRSRSGASTEVATIEGVEVHKFSAEAKDFIILFCKTATAKDIQAVCQGQCAFEGHPDRGGAAFAVVKGKSLVSKLLKGNKQKVELLEADSMDYMIPELESSGLATISSTKSWGLERSGVPGRVTTGAGVHIYVQDTGVRITHDDFGGRATATLDLTNSGGLEECEPEGLAPCADDKQGHGSHCAGTAAGTGYGVASGAFIHGVKTLGDTGGGQRSWQMMALDWLTINAERPAVISMSLGGSGQDPSYTESIGAAVESGITVVVAAGNSNADTCNFSPAFVDTAITVGATDINNERASYSNFGSCNDIMAPGSDITSAAHDSDTGEKTMSGTSMACPHVSGGAALLLETDPSLTSSDILARMKETARMYLIADLKKDDPEEFLWVSGAAAPTSVPTPAPVPTPKPTGPCGWYCSSSYCGYSWCSGCDFC